jgi:hypothetical protein
MKTSYRFFARPPIAAFIVLLLAVMILISRGDALREWRTDNGVRRQPVKEVRAENAASAKISSAQAGAALTQTLVPGGGGASASGGRVVAGSAGQSVVGSSSGGDFKLDGGFWHGAPLSPCAGAVITLTPGSLPDGAVGVAYSQTVSASPAGAYSFALAQGALPQGLSLNGATGVISGTPVRPGGASFTINATNASGCVGSRAYTLTINCPTISFSPQTLAGGELGAPYNQKVTASPAGAYTYVVDQGSLPPGLTLDNATGVISGAPQARGSLGFSVRATLSSGPCFNALSLPKLFQLFFIDGADCSVADAFVCLTKNQTTSFLASDLDPGTTGYIIAVAVDRATGCPIKFNHLIGDEYVKLSSGHEANLVAEAFVALADNPSSCNADSTTARLDFDGKRYGLAPRALAL